MWQQLCDALLPHFSIQRTEDLTLVAIKTAIVYVFLILGLRLMGKRSLGQMNIYDLILIIVLANAVQNAMVGDDNTVAGGMVAAATLMVLNRLFTALLARSRKLEHAMVGHEVLIVSNGHFHETEMGHEGITRDQVMSALREHGMDNVKDVRACVLEVDGSLSIIPGDAKVHRTRRHFKALRMP